MECGKKRLEVWKGRGKIYGGRNKNMRVIFEGREFNMFIFRYLGGRLEFLCLSLKGFFVVIFRSLKGCLIIIR